MPFGPGLPDLAAIQSGYRNKCPGPWAAFRVPIASLTPVHDALPPVSFASNPALAPASGTMPTDPRLPNLTAIQSSYRNRRPGPWTVVRDPVARLAPTQDALSAASFARNTVLGPLLQKARPEVGLGMATLPVDNQAGPKGTRIHQVGNLIPFVTHL